MFLHVGNHKNIRIRDVVGIFDMDNATLSSVTRKFLSEKQKQLLVEIAAVELPKSFVLFEENGLYKICFSPLSSSALKGRMNDFEFER
ncbi:MAG: DUF370 domain-containing protein [Clostridia bacterium]|nr:DUF370 domain-containing protein [Clostridia bacterium]